MKKIFFIILLMLIQFNIAKAVDNSITSFAEPLNVVKNHVKVSHPEYSNVNYFIINNENNDLLKIFVDPFPLANWGHTAYIYTINYQKGEAKIANIETVNNPPTEKLLSLELSIVDNTTLVTTPIKSTCKKAVLLNSNQTGSTTYALILSGGINPDRNKVRYWNDCSFIYQTLVSTYSINKDNIYVAMSDGTNPNLDLCIGFNEYISSPLDLDFDGVDDIKYGANIVDLRTIIRDIYTKIQEDDTLFIYVIDHGSYDKQDRYRASICLWNNAELYDNVFTELIKPISQKNANISIVLGQCYSGGFIDNLSEINCSVATACNPLETSNAMYNLKYDEYVYYWTCAVNGADPRGNIMDADYNKDGYITMDEAHQFAIEHDEMPETPQYQSTPVSLGEDLAFNKIPESVDLYIKNFPEDTGKRPYINYDTPWLDASVWSAGFTNIPEHTQTDLNNGPTSGTLKTWVHNRGKKAYNTGDKYLHAYWGMAAPAFNNLVWNGVDKFNDTYRRKESGGYIASVPLTQTILPGDSVLISINYSLPTDITSWKDNKNPVMPVSFMTRISDSDDTECVSDWWSFYDDLLYGNNHAYRGVSTLKRENTSRSLEMLLHTHYEYDGDMYTLELRPVNDSDMELFDVAKVYMDLSPDFYNYYFYRVGANNVEPSADRQNSIQLTRDSHIVSGISLPYFETQKITYHVVFNSPTAVGKEPQTYKFDLIQRDYDDTIVGGQRIEIERPVSSMVYPPIYIENVGDGSYDLSVSNDDENSITWFDSQMNLLTEEELVNVLPTKNNHEYYVATHTSEGEMSVASVDLRPSFTIDSVKDNGSALELNISDNIGKRNGMVIVTAVGGSRSISVPIQSTEGVVSIDMNSIEGGIVNISCVVDGEVTDTINYNVKK